MTHRFPHDFWAERPLDIEPGCRFDSALPQGLRPEGPYGFSRGLDWDALVPEIPEEDLLRHFIDETALDDIELDEEPLDEGPHACLVEDLHPKAAQAGLFVPEKYEPNYPYPLIVWFHEAGGSESDMLSLLPRISQRNYFGLSLRGLLPVGEHSDTGFTWPEENEAVSRLEKDLYHTLCELRRNFHIHSERVFLAGSGKGAEIALRLFLNRIEWFAGVLALGTELPPFDPNTAVHSELCERRVFLTMPPGEARKQNARLWRAKGLNLHLETEESVNLSSGRLSQLNHFVMESICTPV
jgi:phospholipase/carboxylesterase